MRCTTSRSPPRPTTTRSTCRERARQSEGAREREGEDAGESGDTIHDGQSSIRTTRPHTSCRDRPSVAAADRRTPGSYRTAAGTGAGWAVFAADGLRYLHLLNMASSSAPICSSSMLPCIRGSSLACIRRAAMPPTHARTHRSHRSTPAPPTHTLPEAGGRAAARRSAHRQLGHPTLRHLDGLRSTAERHRDRERRQTSE
jgi:hypothetical protein